MEGEPASGAVSGFDIGNEGYVIRNEPGRDIVISARTRPGFFYAYQTLLQAAEIGADGSPAVTERMGRGE